LQFSTFFFFVAMRPNAGYDLSFMRFLDHTQTHHTR